MAHTEPTTYRRITGKVENRERKGRIKPRNVRQQAVLYLAGFFIAMAMPYSGIAPFGMSYLARERKLSVGAFLSFLAVSLGSVAACDRVGGAKYVGAGVIYLAVLFVLERGVHMNEVTAGLVAACSLAVSGLAAMVWQEFSIGGVMLLACEAASVFAGALVLDKVQPRREGIGLEGGEITNEERLSLGAVAVILILSLKELYIGSDFSVMNTFVSVAVLMVAVGCGVGYSTAAGIILGVVCGTGTEYFMPILGAFGFCGFMAGTFSRFGKGGTIAGMVLANAMMIVYTDGAMEMMLTLYEIMAASIVFAFIPMKYCVRLRRFLCLEEKEKKSIQKVRDGIKQRLFAVAASFESMSAALERLSDKENTADVTDVAVLFDAAADKICRDCRKSSVCWGKEFNSTYKSLFKLLEIMEEKGELSEADVPEYFKLSCLNFSKLLGELNRQFDVYRVRRVWKSKLSESRELVGEQLAGMSKIIDDLAEEVGYTAVNMSVSAEEIRAKLSDKGIRPIDLSVVCGRDGRYKLEMTVKSSQWKANGVQVVKKLLMTLTGCEASVCVREDENTEVVRLEVAEKERYMVETGVASADASVRSGDNHRFVRIGGGKYLAALSDGMGTGERAARESDAMLELLDSFLRAGFDSRVAVKLINSVMVMKSETESFVTMDLCIIDLYSGKAEFIKTGAEPSFILQKNRIETVSAQSLPTGVLAGADAEVTEREVGDGDTVIMLTDGVEPRIDGGERIRKYIEYSRSRAAAEEIAGGILKLAIDENRGEVKDDMTVLALKLKKRGDVA